MAPNIEPARAPVRERWPEPVWREPRDHSARTRHGIPHAAVDKRSLPLTAVKAKGLGRCSKTVTLTALCYTTRH